MIGVEQIATALEGRDREGNTYSTEARIAVGIFGLTQVATTATAIKFSTPGLKEIGRAKVTPAAPPASTGSGTAKPGGKLATAADKADNLPATPPGNPAGVAGSNPRPLSPSHYPNPDPPMSAPPVRHEPHSVGEVVRMRQGKGPTTKATHGTANIEAHHRHQVPVEQGGVIDELEMRTHRGVGSHSRHSQPSQLTLAQRAKEIREHWIRRGLEYILPGEGI